jgi:hypothetical protein
MLYKILAVAVLIATHAWGQEPSEEAIILNQEMQYLEESANNVTISSNTDTSINEVKRPVRNESLEKEYFGNEAESTISTKAAAPKRRSY